MKSVMVGEGEAGRLFTIGDLEAMTGVTGATLRTWERRFGFPVPARTAGGQRRYLAADAARVRRVIDERGRGLTLEAAIRAVVRDGQAGAGSLFAELRSTHPHLDPIQVSMRVMKALTWSIEDECMAHASRPLLFGCFQNEHTFELAGLRWRELARSAAAAVVMSDFPVNDASAAPARVALPPRSPMLNEWAVVCLDPRLSAVLVAWEPPRSGPDGGGPSAGRSAVRGAGQPGACRRPRRRRLLHHRVRGTRSRRPGGPHG